MPGFIGALKGMLGGAGLLLAAALVPILAAAVAAGVSSRWDVGFWLVFAGVLAVGGFLGLCAAFGIAKAAEEAHAEELDDAGGAGGTPV